MPIKYLDPKNDLTFKRVFGDHPHLLISFLNAMLPLAKDRFITSLEYLDNEIIPELPGLKRSIVDVRCIDNYGRQFIVEMQMYWTSSFKSRMLFNASKAYVKQLYKKEKFSELRPVYGLSLVNEDFQKSEALKQTYYHHFKLTNTADFKDCIPGIELIFIELQKFKSLNFTDKRLQVLWLKFLTLIDEDTTDVPQELKNEKDICEALECVNQSAFSQKELDYYDKYWDAIRVEKSTLADSEEKVEKAEKELQKMEEKVEQERIAKELAQKLATEAQKLADEAQKLADEAKEREAEAKERETEAKNKQKELNSKLKNIILRLHSKGFTIEEIATDVEISADEVKKLLE